MPGWDANDQTLPEVPPLRRSHAARKLALTILYHPDTSRIGERAPFNGGTESDLSRLQPQFAPVRGDGAQRPLADSYLSRSPVSFRWQGASLLLVPPMTGTSLKVNGVEQGTSLSLDAEQLDRGVVLCLAHRLVLLLHHAPEEPAAADTQGLVGEHDSVQRLRQMVSRVAAADTPVLLLGESGTGKELVATAIHRASARASASMVTVNMAAIPAELAAAELFGVRRGAYTGADTDRPGYFQNAHGGTLFLDEIGACDAAVQAQLLRALQQGEVQRPGGDTETVNVRVLAATDSDPDSGFSTALRHRLAGIELQLSPLRQRREDIGRLLHHFLDEGLLHRGVRDPKLASQWAELVTRLVLHDWPGNIRQLANACCQLNIANVDSPTLVIPDSLERELRSSIDRSYSTASAQQKATPTDNRVREAMLAARWEVSRAARELEISRQALYRRIESIPDLRTAADIPAPEVESAFFECKGDLEQAALRLQVSQAALRRRWRALDLLPGGW